jgi:L-fucose isomerase-like protein
MAMNSRPRLGVLLVTSGWFRDVGLQAADSDISAEADRAGSAILGKLEEFCDPVCDGVVCSVGEAAKAAARIRGADVDGILVAPLMWCEDAIPRGALAGLKGLPILLWTFSPAAGLPDFVPFQTMLRGSGAVCTMQLSGMLVREGIEFHSVEGHAEDPAVFEEIAWFAAAAAVKRSLAGARVGVLPFPCDQMSTTWVDQFALRARYGVELRFLELERVRSAAAACDAGEIREFRDSMDSGVVRMGVDAQNLEEGIRYAIALGHVAREERLSAFAMNDVIAEMHASFGLRPCLSHAGLSDAGVVVSMEADAAAAVAMLALRRFTGERPFYTEPFSVDWNAGALLMGHAGMHDARNADPSCGIEVVPDVEYENTDRFTGAATLFKYREGATTLVNSVWDGGRLRWAVAEGTSLGGPMKMDGNCHLVFVPDSPVKDFLRFAVELGVSQHWIAIPGRRARGLSRLCGILGIGFETAPGSP